MANSVRELFDSKTIQTFEKLAREVVDLVDAGRIDYAFTKIKSVESVIRSMSFTEPMLQALPGLTNQSLTSFFGANAASAINTPVLAYSGSSHHGLYCRCFACNLTSVIASLCKLIIQAGMVVAGIALVVWGSGAWIALGYALFVILVMWIVWEGQQPPRVALRSNPTFMARLEREIVVATQQAQSNLLIS